MASVGPSIDSPDRAVIPPTVLAAVLDIGRHEGLSVPSWLSGTGLDPALLYAPGARVSLQQARTVLRRALAAMPGRALGLDIGERDVLLSFGLLGVAMRASETLGEGLTLAEELHQASGSLLDVEREDLGDRIGVRFWERWPDPELVAFLCEEALISTVMVIRSMLADPTWAPLRVDLTYAPPAHAARYHQSFRCPITFRAEANRMVIPAALMERRITTRHEPTRRAAIEASRAMLAPGDPPSDLVASLETLLAGHLRRPLSMRDVAERLHVTERTLHRRLAEAGVRFRDVANRVRERRATSLLRHSPVPVSEVATEVGFGDSREFRRAYARWTGRTPSQARGAGHQ
ncbi:AraC family transcriptional regulator [Prauserella cavernicola]|uniref:AraC family transcriptional regulator n=1 Tax=Prauserella cavernicola TaxID=2800127 RepID=A0A934QRZ7_9PSEU|nr:AraC family transcriptional regulator [Prauserella cavernicola]MBK1787147.1 AraC family transcriptional regulator [Prauserella cavernicola]